MDEYGVKIKLAHQLNTFWKGLVHAESFGGYKCIFNVVSGETKLISVLALDAKRVIMELTAFVES